MHSLLKSTVLGVGLLAGVSATAHAQSVSTVPPTSPATAPTATTAPVVSSAKIYPNPGRNTEWIEEHHQATESAKIYPNPGRNSEWVEGHSQATETDNDRGRHPYSGGHFGPPPN